jgi:hypothetical protein
LTLLPKDCSVRKGEEAFAVGNDYMIHTTKQMVKESGILHHKI